MTRIALCDESGIQSGNRCYGIGAFVVPSEAVPILNAHLRGVFSGRGVTNEVKWNHIGSSRSYVDAACSGIDLLLKSGAAYHAIVVEKATFHQWHENEEKAFYMTYQFLASHIAKSGEDAFECWIDGRNDSYDKYPEVMTIITNYKTARKAGTAELLAVKKVDSKAQPIVQMTDVLTGAVTADTHRFLLERESELTAGKENTIRRLAEMIGWDRLCYDTYPNSSFNVWHFPTEFRARPRTRQVLQQGLLQATAASLVG